MLMAGLAILLASVNSVSAGTLRHVVVQHPPAKVDQRVDPKLRKAAAIADRRAHPHSKSRCWQYVKLALLEAGAVWKYPKTHFAWQAGLELTKTFGFRRLPIRDPYAAPLGAIIVYDGGRFGYGHVEIRTRNGFASDYRSPWRCRYTLDGVYAR
jgi:hypothetical protein